MAASRTYTSGSYIAGSAATSWASVGALTFAAWVYRAATGTFNMAPAVNYINSGAYVTALYWWTDNNVYNDIRTGGYGYYASTATGWNHIAMVFDGSATGNANRLKGYLNGVQQTLTFSGTIGTATPAFPSGTLDIGRLLTFGPNYTSTGNGISHTHTFLRALTAAEVSEIMWNPMAYRANRVDHWPVYGVASPEPNLAGGTAGTLNGTVAASALGPAVTYG